MSEQKGFSASIPTIRQEATRLGKRFEVDKMIEELLSYKNALQGARYLWFLIVVPLTTTVGAAIFFSSFNKFFVLMGGLALFFDFLLYRMIVVRANSTISPKAEARMTEIIAMMLEATEIQEAIEIEE